MRASSRKWIFSRCHTPSIFYAVLSLLIYGKGYVSIPPPPERREYHCHAPEMPRAFLDRNDSSKNSAHVDSLFNPLGFYNPGLIPDSFASAVADNPEGARARVCETLFLPPIKTGMFDLVSRKDAREVPGTSGVAEMAVIGHGTIAESISDSVHIIKRAVISVPLVVNFQISPYYKSNPGLRDGRERIWNKGVRVAIIDRMDTIIIVV